ncbi:DUF6449 domain-containing protein [Bacillus sp. cl95]|uniref:DUF6449 domain-containing protein n=2 Tax=unclassified Bacillus (in: firmicutes) TaxID=185979 RepID=UPI0008E3C553|nr:DUF6449 domain-containing protein [Bacillus sp. cl95]SFB07001.1 ABC-2 type transport system permease protein [Bacillus sp. UNCCL13]SFQ87500.1 ABC-2 type transport system permease protein [Bacillus sp. cl95]
MPSKTSLLNKELILQTIRSGGWISLIYFAGLFFAIPLRLLMMYAEENEELYLRKVDSLFQYDYEIQIFLIVILPVALAVFLFRYLQVKQSVDLMHSVPISRDTIFHHYAISGMAFLILPIIINAVVVLMLHSILGLDNVFLVRDVLRWAGVTIVFNLLIFLAGTFVAMMTGMSIVQAVISYIFLLFPAGIMVLLLLNFKVLLYGFPSDYFLNQEMEKMSPLTFATMLNQRPFHWQEAITYIFFIILFYALALFLYKRRKLEAASEAIAFPKMRAIFKYGVTFCTMLAGGMYFSLVPYSSFGWIVFGYVLGAIIGYYVAEMILRKTWRVFGNVKGLAVYGVFIAILISVIQFLGIYENYVPAQNEIESVRLADNSHMYIYRNEVYEDYYIPKPLKEKVNIEAVRKLHKQIVADKKMNQVEEDIHPLETAFFLYELKNGDQVIREYTINRDIYSELLSAVYGSKEFKMMTKEIFEINEDKIETIKVRANGYVDKVATISEPEDIQEAIAALRADELAESYEDGAYFQNRGSSIEIHLGKDKFLHLDFKPSYVQFTNWLKEHDLLDRAKVMSDDISHVVVMERKYSDYVDPDVVINDIKANGDFLKITDKEQIDQALNKAGWNFYNSNYAAVFYYKVGNMKEVLFFDEEHVPDFIKNHFK